MRTIVLAGGYGTRLHPITAKRPKPLLPLAGRAIIDYILDDPALPGTPIISTNRRFADAFVQWKESTGRDVELVVEETRCEEEKLGTIGALSYVLDRCGVEDDVLVIAGDNLFGFAIESFLASYRGNPLIALHEMESLDAVRDRYGVVSVHDGRITGFQEKPRHPRSTLASTACYIYPRSTLTLLREYLATAPTGKDAPGYFNEWCLQERGVTMDPFIFHSPWFDIGDRESYLAANRHLTSGAAWIGPGVETDDADIRDSILLGQATVCRSSITRCVIDTDCQLEDVTLEDCLVGTGTVLMGKRQAEMTSPSSDSTADGDRSCAS
jgi:glucose-1-phosphate thymidylyltransferase